MAERTHIPRRPCFSDHGDKDATYILATLPRSHQVHFHTVHQINSNDNNASCVWAGDAQSMTLRSPGQILALHQHNSWVEAVFEVSLHIHPSIAKTNEKGEELKGEEHIKSFMLIPFTESVPKT